LFTITSGSHVLDSSWTNGLKPSITQNGGTVTVTWNAPAAGTYIISIKFDATSVKNATAPTPSTVHYDFSTAGVPGSTRGLDLVKNPNYAGFSGRSSQHRSSVPQVTHFQ